MRNGKQLLRLLERFDDFRCEVMRWDSLYLCPASRLAADVFEDVKAFLSGAEHVEVKLCEPGDTLIIDNWRCLHGRSAVLQAGESRRIDRVYLTELR